MSPSKQVRLLLLFCVQSLCYIEIYLSTTFWGYLNCHTYSHLNFLLLSSLQPSSSPTAGPSKSPSKQPTPGPSVSPSKNPTDEPTPEVCVIFSLFLYLFGLSLYPCHWFKTYIHLLLTANTGPNSSANRSGSDKRAHYSGSNCFYWLWWLVL